MHRICSSLANNGYEVTLVGRKQRLSAPLQKEVYRQLRLRCYFTKGKFFYAEYNLRLFFFLLFKKIDIVCAIDLDTILPCLVISKVKKILRVYDAHELFTELKEVIRRPWIKRFWTGIEKYAVPKFKNGYTVSEGISTEFKKRYNVTYETIRNVPFLKKLDLENSNSKAKKCAAEIEDLKITNGIGSLFFAHSVSAFSYTQGILANRRRGRHLHH